MDIATHITRRLALLPDESLMHVLHAMSDADAKNASGRQTLRSERLNVISRELQARGLFGPPWWSAARRPR